MLTYRSIFSGKSFWGSRVLAIQAATFAAFVGAIGGLCVLFWYWKKRKPHLDKLLEQDKGELTVSLPEMYKEIVKSAFPFVIVGIAIPLYQMIDTLLFTRAMELAGEAKTSALSLLGAMSFSSHKLVMIPVSLATAFSLTLVPLITASFVREEPKQLKKQIDTIFQILLFLTIPAALGMSLLAEPLYTAFFGYSEIGGDILRQYAPVAIGFALFSVSAAILQGINKQKFTVFSFLIGFVCKLALTVPLVYMVEETGLILSYIVGFTVSIVMNAIVIRRSIDYQFTLVFRRVLLMILMNLVMLGATAILYLGLKNVLDVSVRMEAIAITAVCGLVGMVLYFLLALRLRLADKLFGSQMKKVRRKLRLEEA
ncbi:polysaccharide biosynthesis C-terminal domain-containing protein [Mangrovibacillus cuniculi]|uniref:lipid II flippase MurJ n=1 Tax=Mangrovibacillus cuniculi TaxID=2593652 RepID=UPI003083F940